MANEISLDELLAEYDRLGVGRMQSDAGMTLKELKETWCVSMERTSDLVKKGKELGIVTLGRRNVIRVDNKHNWVTVYIFTLPPAKKAKTKQTKQTKQTK